MYWVDEPSMSFAAAAIFSLILLISQQQMHLDSVGICSHYPYLYHSIFLATFKHLLDKLPATVCYHAKDSSKSATKVIEAFASPVLSCGAFYHCQTPQEV